MQDAETVLRIIRERGEQGKPLERVYRMFFNTGLFLYAYDRIARNDGAMTGGVKGETVDGMSLAKIQRIIDLLRREAYVWTPVRRIHIPKKRGGVRPLGIPDWGDKLVQEVIRLILEAYYEPRFSDASHGFRPGRGCHTALRKVRTWTATTWFIEGDIKGCFDNIDHDALLKTLGEHIRDNRFLRLIQNMLQAGYMENWVYGKTLSGTPQGGVVSPILSNIYLGKLDQFVEHTLAPAYTRGTRKRSFWAYEQLRRQVAKARRRGEREKMRRLRIGLRHVPSRDPHDPDFRRLWYVRYADDFLLGFIGPKQEAEEIKRLIGDFLRDTLHLTMSPEKTLITHASSEAARFLGYEVTTHRRNDYMASDGKRLCHPISFHIPAETVESLRRQYMDGEHPRRYGMLEQESDFAIVAQFGSAFRGYYNYFQYASNAYWLGRVRRAMEQSLFHTLADKHKTSVLRIVRRLRATTETQGRHYVCYEVRVPRENKPPLIARFGGFPLTRNQLAALPDAKPLVGPRITHSERLKKLLHEECELCGARGPVEEHHIRKLADLKKHGRHPSKWVQVMAARRRKSLFVCEPCHDAITYGHMHISQT